MSKNNENSQQNENLNKKSPQEQNNQPPEEQPGFFQKYMWYIIFFIAFQIGSSFFRKNNPNDPQLTGILEEGTKFDVNFYLSTKDHYT